MPDFTWWCMIISLLCVQFLLYTIIFTKQHFVSLSSVKCFTTITLSGIISKKVSHCFLISTCYSVFNLLYSMYQRKQQILYFLKLEMEWYSAYPPHSRMPRLSVQKLHYKLLVRKCFKTTLSSRTFFFSFKGLVKRPYPPILLSCLQVCMSLCTF